MDAAQSVLRDADAGVIRDRHSMQATVHASTTPTTDPLDDPSLEAPLTLDVPPLDDDGADAPIDAGPTALDTHVVDGADFGDEPAENKADRDFATSAMIGDEESALGDEAMALASEPIDDDEIVAGDERGLLKDSDEPDGRELDAREAGIDDDDASTTDDGGAEGPRESVEALVGGDATSAWDRLGRRERAALRATIGQRSLEAIAAHGAGFVVALVDERGERCAVVALDGDAVATIAELDLGDGGDVRALAVTGDTVVLTLTRGERRIPIATGADR